MSDTRLWGARFRAGPDPTLQTLSRSPQRHHRLIPYDIAASVAHAGELQRAGLLDAAEHKTMVAALLGLRDDYLGGKAAPSEKDEDIHTFCERVLTEQLGPLGGKLRAGRSRNDQAANDLKLYLRDQARTLVGLILDLQDALIGQAKTHIATPAPGFTHLQPAQPVAFGHQLLAHAQSFARDVERFQDWDRRAARSPLGAAALAGSAIALHPELAAKELGYDGVTENSMDAVGSRDHVAEFLFVAAMHGVHLSRLSEEIILWASRQFRWIALDDSFATGSSIMPQKKNPDIAEIARGRSGRLIGDVSAMLAMLKGLPLAYNRDMMEDKAFAFDAVDGLAVVLPALTGLVRTMKVNADALKRDAVEGFTLATEIADWLSRKGVPFSTAHEITGAVVRHCEERNIGFDGLAPGELAKIDARLDDSLRPLLTPEAAIAARRGYGGTAAQRVREQMDRLLKVCDAQRAWCADYNGPRAPIR